MALRTEQNTQEIQEAVRTAFEESPVFYGHRPTDPFFEHGQWWITCLGCGAQRGACDAEYNGDETFDFDQVTEGDPDEHEA